MAGVKQFEDLLMWQRARQLSNLTYRLTAAAAFKDASLRNQMRRAAVSVMSNIAEGFGRGSNEEFLHFLFIAKGSLAEWQSQLYLALDLGFVSKAQFQEASDLSDQTARMIQSFARSMKGVGRTGFRHRRQQIPWAERVQGVMKEIEEAKKEE